MGYGDLWEARDGMGCRAWSPLLSSGLGAGGFLVLK